MLKITARTLLLSTCCLFLTTGGIYPAEYGAAQRLADREAIEDVLNRANSGFELSDPDLFAGAFAEARAAPVASRASV